MTIHVVVDLRNEADVEFFLRRIAKTLDGRDGVRNGRNLGDSRQPTCGSSPKAISPRKARARRALARGDRGSKWLSFIVPVGTGSTFFTRFPATCARDLLVHRDESFRCDAIRSTGGKAVPKEITAWVLSKCLVRTITVCSQSANTRTRAGAGGEPCMSSRTKPAQLGVAPNDTMRESETANLLAIQMLDGFSVRRGLTRLPMPGSAARLVAYLCLAGPTHRNQLGGRLWPDAQERCARRRLRNTLWLRHPDSAGLVRSTNSTASWRERMMVDLVVFNRWAWAVIDHGTSASSRHRYAPPVVHLRRSESLPGWDQEGLIDTGSDPPTTHACLWNPLSAGLSPKAYALADRLPSRRHGWIRSGKLPLPQ